MRFEQPSSGIRAPERASCRYSDGFLEVLLSLEPKILVTRIQAGRLIVLRVRDGALNMHVRRVQHPVGRVIERGRLTLGVYNRAERYYDKPAVSNRVAPGESLDAALTRVPFTRDPGR